MLKFLRRLTIRVLAAALVMTLLVSAITMLGRIMPRPRLLSYVRMGDGIYLLDVNHNLSAYLIRDPQVDMQLVWSPDGSDIAFVTRRHSNGDVYRVAIHNPSDIQRLTRNSAEDTNPTWSPDGKWVAFVSSRDNGQEVYMTEVSSGRLRNLTQNRTADFRPAWSPGGGQIAFVSRRVDNYEIFLLDSPCLQEPITCTANPRMIYNLSRSPRTDETPVWSPDGKWLAFVSQRHDNNDVYVIDANCIHADKGCLGAAINMTRHGGGDSSPVWSPDGDWLLFASGRNRDTEIYAVKTRCLLTGERCDFQAHNITRDSASDYNPAWSADGALIAFISGRNGYNDIYVMDGACVWGQADCPAPRRLTIDGGVAYPVWQP